MAAGGSVAPAGTCLVCRAADKTPGVQWPWTARPRKLFLVLCSFLITVHPEQGCARPSCCLLFSTSGAPSLVFSSQRRMENILAGLCGTTPGDPLPVWVHGRVGHCFNQLALNVVPHVVLAVVSACFLGTPRYDDSLVWHLIIMQDWRWDGRAGN